MSKSIGFIIVFVTLGGIMQLNSLADEKLEKAIFAGGCFWCMEADFDKIAGVEEVVSGYTGGTGINPTYEDYGKKGHIEAVELTYDPSKISYKQLLDLFWRKIDPTDGGGQFCDRGQEYTTAIFYNTEEQKHLAEETKKALEESAQLKAPVVTEIVKAGKFYRAEDYHQDYYQKNPLKYKFYRFNCGRDRRLKEIWGESVNYDKSISSLSNCLFARQRNK
jgi:methionine-S-sulfoxide reductase